MSLSALDIYNDSPVVDMTVCSVPGDLFYPTDLAYTQFLDVYAKAGLTWASLTLAADESLSISAVIRQIARARSYVMRRPETLILMQSMDDVDRAKREGKMAINFHFQGSNPFAGNIQMVEVYRHLGVGHALLAYNNRNLMADGCHEPSNAGLSKLGHELVREMNRVGMVLDVTHTGYQSSMDAIAASSRPVIFSHSNCWAIHNHERNVKDDQIQAVAATDGVIGINGVGLFLSDDEKHATPEAIFRHVDHAVQLVGAKHVGFGIDWVRDLETLESLMVDSMILYPEDQGYSAGPQPDFASPAVIFPVVELMAKAGYQEDAIRDILGLNWVRAYSAASTPQHGSN